MTFQSTNILYVNGTGIGPGVLTSIVCILKIFLYKNLRLGKSFYQRLRLLQLF